MVELIKFVMLWNELNVKLIGNICFDFDLLNFIIDI